MAGSNDLIDMDEIMEIMDNDSELIQECFDDFVREYPEMLQNIEQSILSGDARGLDIHAHKIKGSLRYLAAAEAADIASKLERKGKGNDLEGAARLLKELAEACEKLKVFMIAYKG